MDMLDEMLMLIVCEGTCHIGGGGDGSRRKAKGDLA